MKSIVHKLIIVILIGLIHSQCFSQTTIQMEDIGGVYKIPCTVNGLRLKMIFDPGAANVCISETVAIMMLENDYLSLDDIKEDGQSQVADGSVVDHTRVILKNVQIGDKVLNNIEAVVIHGQDAPLLFGQSALRKIGYYTISGNTLIIGKQNKDEDVRRNQLTDDEASDLLKEASIAYKKMHIMLHQKYSKLYMIIIG